ncbi:hypothetical protein CF394_08850 [Tetzosporium hominis]|uniref:NERD domain-containing protein n=1 Tax=Tetzosporium hominis TaxID=2020506 RepID=A0A264W2P8_9BACL|nr:nuclease-related domain-containing protein [Tetzosporium hominis]OZS77852.1 hypothetical protein CF394_08850 [Tetzosporium hominis]
MVTIRKAGERGENEVLPYLQESYYKQPVSILHNYHSRKAHSFSIQIDYLILTNRYILLLEVKNIKGHITFRQNPAQLIRMIDGEMQALDCPFTQMDRNLLHFKQLLGKSKLPIFTAIVWANRSAVIEDVAFPTTHPVLSLKQLPTFLHELSKHPVQQVNVKSLQKRLQSLATPFYLFSLCSRYEIVPTELIKGMQCPTCFGLLLLNQKSWNCTECKLTTTSALEANILNVFDLLGDQLSMRDFHQVLPDLQARNLKKLIASGAISILFEKKNRLYKINRNREVNWLEVEKL